MAKITSAEPGLPANVPVGGASLTGALVVPAAATGVVVFAHGSGSSRHSPRNQYVARVLERRRLGTLLIDLLTTREAAVDERTAQYRFDIPRLAERLVAIVDWLHGRADTQSLPIGLFGASTGAGAALMAAARRPDDVSAVVSRGGRPDLAGAALGRVRAPTLLLVGAQDDAVIQLNRHAMRQMRPDLVSLEIVAGATHLFAEPGTLEEVATRAAGWFVDHVRAGAPSMRSA